MPTKWSVGAILGFSTVVLLLYQLLAWSPEPPAEKLKANPSSAQSKTLLPVILKLPPGYSTVLITPAGGNYRIPIPPTYQSSGTSDIVLDVPPGAVNDPVTIGIWPLGRQETEPILHSYGNLAKYFIGGFQAVPASFRFNKPIVVTIPAQSQKLNSDLLYHFRVDMDDRLYSFAKIMPVYLSHSDRGDLAQLTEKTVLVYFPGRGSVRIAIEDLSQPHVVAALEKMKSESDCQQEPCRCGNIQVTETSRDELVDGFCFLSQLSGQVTYLDCQGAPTETWTMQEMERGKITVHPNAANIRLWHTLPLTAIVTDAGDQPIAHPTNITWSSADTTIASINSTTGVVNGSGLGQTTITADAGCNAKGTARITVHSPVTSVEVNPSAAAINGCGTQVLRAIPRDAQGNAIGDAVCRWSSPYPGIVSINPRTGTEVTVKALAVYPDVVPVEVSCEGAAGHADIATTGRMTGSLSDPPGDLSDLSCCFSYDPGICRSLSYTDVISSTFEWTQDQFTAVINFSAEPEKIGTPYIRIYLDTDRDPSTGCSEAGIGADYRIDSIFTCYQAPCYGYSWIFYNYAVLPPGAQSCTISTRGPFTWNTAGPTSWTIQVPASHIPVSPRPINIRIQFVYTWCEPGKMMDWMPDLSSPPASLVCAPFASRNVAKSITTGP